MDVNRYLILVKGEDQTEHIIRWRYSEGKYHITYRNGRTYSYRYGNVVIHKEPAEVNTQEKSILINNQFESNVEKLLIFDQHIRIFYKSGFNKVVPLSQVRFVRSCLVDEKPRNVFDYLKTLAAVLGLKSEDGSNILQKHYGKIDFIREDSVLAAFLDPEGYDRSTMSEVLPKFPFGFNHSQQQAVTNALSHKISIIEGPPGTGKTQTILNIIANILINNQSVAVVSGNNSATANVLEKMEKHGIGFLAAFLGSSMNKEEFIKGQQAVPDLDDWMLSQERAAAIEDELIELNHELNRMLTNKNKLSKLRSELDEIETEKKYYDEYYLETNNYNFKINSIYALSSTALLRLWNEYEMILEKGGRLSFWTKIKHLFRYGVYGKSLYRLGFDRAIAMFQKQYYQRRMEELQSEIFSLESELAKYHFDAEMQRYSELSMNLLKHKISQRYTSSQERKIYDKDDLWKNSEQFIQDYPVILSTTYSLKSSLSATTNYDYLIIDEASQVDIVTGALAFSCASRVVIVGDQMQLPNVVSQETAAVTDKIFESHSLSPAYRYSTNSILSASVQLFPDAPRTLLREHYRCHPKIIEFCNKKFYDNQLIVLTEGKQDVQPLKVYKTIQGNHARGRENQREIDVIFNEIVHKEHLNLHDGSVGIITPYNQQIRAVKKRIQGAEVDVSTVHKFQGREKECIILTTVDNEISEFVDMPNLLNVAVSRAVKQLILVTTGNEAERATNINDLVNYIEYNNFEVVQSELYSVFDYLYKGYAEQRRELLKKMKRISIYDSENLMYGLLVEILRDEQFRKLGVACHVPLKMIIRDFSKLEEAEVKYAMNDMTHVDFLIYDQLSHKPVLVIEVDGTKYHSEGSRQAERDAMKDQILSRYSISFMRLRTDGSEERRKIRERLTDLLK